MSQQNKSTSRINTSTDDNHNDSSSNNIRKNDTFDLLDVTASLGYQTHRRSSRKAWSREDDQELIALINDALKQVGYKNGILDIKSIQESSKIVKLLQWDVICSKFSNKSRNPKDLKKRWTGSLNPNVKKGRWTKEEDELLLKSYKKHGAHWMAVAMEIEGRTEDQCAKRYVEVLDPSSKERLREWTQEEDLLLISKVKQYGTRWRCICKEMDSRPSLTCRNRWRKIITTVIRGQAPDIIVNAVYENKDLDLKKLIRESNNNSNDRKPIYDENNLQKIKIESNKSNRKKQTTDVRQIYDYTAGLSSTTTSLKNTVLSKIPYTTTSPSTTTPPLSRLTNSLPPLSSHSKVVQNNARSVTDLRNLASNGITSAPPLNISKVELNTDLHSQLSNNSASHNKLAYNNNSNNHTGAEYLSTNRTSDIISNVASTSTSIKDNKNSTKPLSHVSQTEWKFVLKDGKGLSISNGTITTSELVEDLIQKAKKYSLKISLHQHIHHHYDTSSSYSKLNDIPLHSDRLLAHNQKNQDVSTPYTSPSASSTNLSQVPNSVFQDLIQRPNSNFAIDTTSPQISLLSNAYNNKDNSVQMDYKENLTGIPNTGPLSPQLDKNLTSSSFVGNNVVNNMPYQLTNPVHDNLNTNVASTTITNDNVEMNNGNNANLTSNKTFSTENDNDTIYFSSGYEVTPTSVQMQRFPTSSSDASSFSLTVGGNVVVSKNITNRSSHFNYLPPTIRPQLESSDSQNRSGRNASLNTLLNPSPRSINGGSHESSSSPGSTGSSSQQKHKNKRSRRRSGSHGSSHVLVNPNAVRNSNKRKRSKMDLNDDTKTIKSTTDYNNNDNDKNGKNDDLGDNKSELSSSPNVYEDGVDFWETLRSLANNSSSKNENENSIKTQSSEHDKDKNTTVKSLFNYGTNNNSHTKVESSHLSHSSGNEYIDPLLPLNPS